MSKVKIQHYVPRSYLKSFSNEKDQIWVFDKQTDRTYLTNIMNVASERYFYDIPVDEINEVLQPEERLKIKDMFEKEGILSDEDIKDSLQQSVEKFFSDRIEGPFKQLLDKVRSRYKLAFQPLYKQAFSEDEKAELSLLIAYQIVRSKEFRQSHFEAKEAMVQAFVDMFGKQYDENYELGSLTAKQDFEFQTLEHAQLIFGDMPVQLEHLLTSHIWFVGVNQASVPFYTSDNPIVKHAHVTHPFMGTKGYGSPGIEIAFPINKNLILIMAERSFHSYLTDMEGSFFPIREENVVFYNSLQVNQSNRHVFCGEEDSALIKTMSKKKGSLARKRKKLIVNDHMGRREY